MLYVKTKGEQPCCPETLKQFHDEIRTKTKMFEMRPDEPKTIAFKMKKGKLIYVQSWDRHVSDIGITDEESERLIREIPRMVRNFVKVPQELLDELGIDMEGNAVENGAQPPVVDPTEDSNASEPEPDDTGAISTPGPEQAQTKPKRKRTGK